ncbi:spore coat protein [Clostridium polyendosporum]|uniref:Spore coat protein n=1 Tax=Clostridium polyendosporum TaxID=69208 RepID=A0A919VEP9_9CLOT|nr:spore coat protein [Clostridium polyendosporum]GIM27645.1 spore coat protein [Clostridium polyendosporum]
MSTILSNIVQNTTDINDEVIAGNMLASAKSAADAYLNATLTSTTPELRAIYSSSLNQVVGGHSALTELTINKGWDNPYNPPTQQLSDVVNKTETTVK